MRFAFVVSSMQVHTFDHTAYKVATLRTYKETINQHSYLSFGHSADFGVTQYKMVWFSRNAFALWVIIGLCMGLLLLLPPVHWLYMGLLFPRFCLAFLVPNPIDRTFFLVQLCAAATMLYAYANIHLLLLLYAILLVSWDFTNIVSFDCYFVYINLQLVLFADIFVGYQHLCVT